MMPSSKNCFQIVKAWTIPGSFHFASPSEAFVQRPGCTEFVIDCRVSWSKPIPTWGGMLSGSGRTFMFQGPWLALAPGLCLTIVVYATNVFGDALRDLLDPRMRGAG